MKKLFYIVLFLSSLSVFTMNMLFISELGKVWYFFLLVISSFGMITGLKYVAEHIKLAPELTINIHNHDTHDKMDKQPNKGYKAT